MIFMPNITYKSCNSLFTIQPEKSGHVTPPVYFRRGSRRGKMGTEIGLIGLGKRHLSQRDWDSLTGNAKKLVCGTLGFFSEFCSGNGILAVGNGICK